MFERHITTNHTLITATANLEDDKKIVEIIVPLRPDAKHPVELIHADGSSTRVSSSIYQARMKWANETLEKARQAEEDAAIQAAYDAVANPIHEEYARQKASLEALHEQEMAAMQDKIDALQAAHEKEIAALTAKLEEARKAGQEQVRKAAGRVDPAFDRRVRSARIAATGRLSVTKKLAEAAQLAVAEQTTDVEALDLLAGDKLQDILNRPFQA